MLCIMESFVQKQGYSYLKLDGGTSISARQPLINKFNEDSTYFVFLLTTRVGGLGVNLTGADRVVIYDPDWNPATDTQARERAWRIGQQNRVTVYRLITAGTIEEKVYHRQIFKQFLTNRVLDDPKQRRFFKSNDLFELFMLKESNKEGSTETAAIFAGTGSEVKLKSLHKNSDKKKNKIKFNTPIKSTSSVTQNEMIPLGKVNFPTFSQIKLEGMKKLAEMLSKKVSLQYKKIETVKTSSKDVSSGVVQAADEDNGDAVPLKGDESQSIGSIASDVAPSGNGEVTPVVDITDTNQEGNPVCIPSVCAIEHSSKIYESGESNNRTSEDVATYTSVECLGSNSKKLGIECTEGNKSEYSIIEKTNTDVAKASGSKINSCSEDGVQNAYMYKQRSRSIEGTEVCSTERHNHHKRKHDCHRKHNNKRKKKKYSLFEGEHVPHLVREETAVKQLHSDDAERNTEHDDYVLRKLFKKSGLQTALRHDTIMEKGPSDYALVEGEAQRVAQEAVKALKESRRQCWRADSGVPSWTGQSGAMRLPSNMRFGKKITQRNSTATTPHGEGDQPSTSSSNARNDGEPMSSSELLARIRARNHLVTPADDLPQLPVPGDNTEILTDIRNFVAFGAVVDGRATTKEVVDKFKDRLPSGSSPLFKFLLQEICNFHRMPSGEGVWRLKAEFRW